MTLADKMDHKWQKRGKMEKNRRKGQSQLKSHGFSSGSNFDFTLLRKLLGHRCNFFFLSLKVDFRSLCEVCELPVCQLRSVSLIS